MTKQRIGKRTDGDGMRFCRAMVQLLIVRNLVEIYVIKAMACDDLDLLSKESIPDRLRWQSLEACLHLSRLVLQLC